MSRPGVCDVCGCAVVRMNEPHPRNGSADGHEYVDGKLKSVRCSQHTKPWTSGPEADAHGGTQGHWW
jgi:hypothetical protein